MNAKTTTAGTLLTVVEGKLRRTAFWPTSQRLALLFVKVSPLFSEVVSQAGLENITEYEAESHVR